MTSINDLSDDIIDVIFSFLPIHLRLGVCSAVSTQFHRIAKEYLYFYQDDFEDEIKGWDSYDLKIKFLNECPNLKILNLGTISGPTKNIPTILLAHTNLVVFNCDYTPIDPDHFMFVLKQNPNLETDVAPRLSTGETIMFSHPKVKVLSLQEATLNHVNDIGSMLDMPCLESLDLRYGHLPHLNLKHPILQKLNLAGYWLWEHDLNISLKNCPSLTELDISDHQSIDNELILQHENLKTLIMHNTTYLYIPIDKLPSLVSLDISFCQYMINVLHLKSNSLLHINIIGTPFKPDEISQICPQIRKIDYISPEDSSNQSKYHHAM